MPNSFRLRAPEHHGTGLKEKSKRAKKSYPRTTSIGTKHLPSASGLGNVCLRKRNGRKRREVDSTGIITLGETPTSIEVKSISSLHKGPDVFTRTNPYPQILRVETPSLSDHTSPTVMVFTT